MIAFICAGGPREQLYDLTALASRQDIVYIGADRGAFYLLQAGLKPTAILGDFDSLNDEEWAYVSSQVSEIHRYAAEKDDTDTDLALLYAVEQGFSEIWITGITGGRLDHSEAAMRSVGRIQLAHEQVIVKVLNNQNELRILVPGTHRVKRAKEFPYMSLFAYDGHVEGITLRGVKYETTNETITRMSSRFTSNEIVAEEATISFTAGICLVVRSHD
ncbi:thiamine diphosphokinase [Caryophanon tenue]|uniref:Thiamine diphosphokinase n=1 Tax=Caryophanon tenue TaxID=33978 RepID=A0A1C0YKC1_9BACL|nr:thiamine diphosphokinase [Caryophanon tenue]OCS87627.1 thiamine pyrophosphokinase [Caryophanon tenue]